MKIRLDDIKAKPLELSYEELASRFPALLETERAGDCSFITPVKVNLSVSREYDHYRASGELKTSVRLECSRCLVSYETDVESAFTIIYTQAKGMPQDEVEVELNEEDLVSVSFEGEELDFLPEIEEQVVMGLPLKPLCSEECRGLCQHCGADLNIAECGCDRGDFNIKFSVLKNFKAEQ